MTTTATTATTTTPTTIKEQKRQWYKNSSGKIENMIIPNKC